MSFATERIKPSSYKITLVEIDLPVDNNALISFEAGIWWNKIVFTKADEILTGSDGTTGYFDFENEIKYNIQSTMIDDILLSRTTSLADLRSTNLSFYYDAVNYNYYIHFDGFDWPTDKNVRIGAVTGFCSQPDKTDSGAFFNDVYYEPRLMNSPKISKSRDPLFFGVMRFLSSSFIINNQDGAFDKYKDEDVYGQPVRVKFGYSGLAYDNFYQLYQGFVEDFDWDFDSFTINTEDRRRFLRRKIPVREYDQTTYPNLSDSNVGKPLPLAYGVIKNAKTICLNQEDGSATTWNFKFMDTTDHSAVSIEAIYVDGNLIAGSAAEFIGQGTFVLSSANNPSTETTVEDNLSNVTVDFTASTIVKGTDVIVDLNNIYAGLPYSSVNYDTTEWALADTLSRDVGIYIDKRKEIIKIIEKICVDIDGFFFTKDSGVFTMRIYDENRAVTRAIQNDEWLADPKFKVDTKEFLTSVVIMHSKDNDKGDYVEFRNSDYEEEVFNKYRTYKEKEIKTNLTNETDADAKSEVIMGRSKVVLPEVSRTTKTQNIDLELMDFMGATHNRQSNSENWKTYEIVGIEKTVGHVNQILITQKEVKTYTPTVITYGTGMLYADKLYGDKLYGATVKYEV